ncbi:Nuclear transcription factor Y subunit B-10 [Camellia lanceoleosa]|uniref:Nuclear transcription factor Y subunit B-10 n=1 Tax=Camellia lanceoleosa TaxID=1840588 RepID=A0ACC0HLH0_9ERIC|nr:Nuclear transcription factor Y subunit B-10 [Camellia lanceoleosa]
MLQMEGDTKGSGKGGEGSGRKDGVHPGPNAQLAYQGSFSQGINYENSQVKALSLSLSLSAHMHIVYDGILNALLMRNS